MATPYRFHDMETLKSLLQIYRRNLRITDEQIARIGPLDTPLNLNNQKSMLLEEIERITEEIKYRQTISSGFIDTTTIEYQKSSDSDSYQWINTKFVYRGKDGGEGYAYHLRMNRRNAGAVVIVSQLLDTGLSLMNVVEYVATEIINIFGLSAESLIFIEHYPEGYLHSNQGKENFDLVQFNWNGKTFSKPRWRTLTKSQVEAIIGHSVE